MTQVSKKYLRREIEEKVYLTFWQTIVDTKNVDEASGFFSEFFTKNEKVNFAKRLTIAILLHKGYEWRMIADMIKVSPTTIGKMAAKLESDEFQKMLAKMDEKEEWKKFWIDIGKTYLRLTHPERLAKLDEEGVENVYFGRKKTF